jgi:hypothetical protein
MSLLTAIQNACDRIGIARPTSVVGSTDQQTLRLLGYAQQEGKELARKYDWQVLVKETTFSSTATAVQTSAGTTVIPQTSTASRMGLSTTAPKSARSTGR